MTACHWALGPDLCVKSAGHDGTHETRWADGLVAVLFEGDDPGVHAPLDAHRTRTNRHPPAQQDQAAKDEAFTHAGLRHWRDQHGQIGRHRPADENCPCRPQRVEDEG